MQLKNSDKINKLSTYIKKDFEICAPNNSNKNKTNIIKDAFIVL